MRRAPQPGGKWYSRLQSRRARWSAHVLLRPTVGQRGRSLLGWYPPGVGRYPTLVPDILIASDASWVWDEVGSVLANTDTTVHAVSTGAQVRAAFVEVDPDLVILDQQVGSMGAFAICYDLRLESGAGRAKPARLLILLDRRADVFLARRRNA